MAENSTLQEHVQNLEKQIVLAALEKSKIIQTSHEKEQKLKEKEEHEIDARKKEWENRFQELKQKNEILTQENHILKSKQQKHLVRVLEEPVSPQHITKSPSKAMTETIKNIEHEVMIILLISLEWTSTHFFYESFPQHFQVWHKQGIT